MTQAWRATIVPALPPARLTADIDETAGGEAYVLDIPVPGLQPEEIVIEVDTDRLPVSTEPQPAKSDSGRRYRQREPPGRPLSRLFECPGEIDPDYVRTTLETGILTIHVPKAAVGRRKVIRVGQSA